MATKEMIAATAAREGSEEGPLGTWPRARLTQTPEAGATIKVGGDWYVAVAGRRREGYKGDFGGLYARWVKVPEAECSEWE